MREFRQATRFSRPDADATLAVARLEAGEVAAGYAFDAVRADLLDTYQARLNEALSDLPAADAQGFASRRAEAAGLAEGYFAILAPAYEEQRGLEAAATARLSFARLRADAVAGLALEPALAGVQTAIEGFRAAPLSPDDQVRRAGQMLRFLSLVPVEYSRGIRNGQVAKDLEIREAITFHDGGVQPRSPTCAPYWPNEIPRLHSPWQGCLPPCKSSSPTPGPGLPSPILRTCKPPPMS